MNLLKLLASLFVISIITSCSSTKKNLGKTTPEVDMGIQLGMRAPDISLPDINGKTRDLSDLKGRVVLLNFWGSWCGPCRDKNSQLVKLYKKYKSQGFDIYSVAVDGLDERMKEKYKSPEEITQAEIKTKNRWKEATISDSLNWANNVSELKRWDTKILNTYEVSSIPKSFLINKKGIIVAINPKLDLEDQLKNLL